MRWLQKLALRVRSLTQRERVDQELDAELSFHLERQIQANLSAGMDLQQARSQALRMFGGVEQLKEECRDTRSVDFVEHFFQDIRYGLRMMHRGPAFACTAILVLALGIGATVAIFAFVDAALIKPLPYRDPTRLVDVTESVAMIPHANLSYPDYLDWKRLNKVFRSLDVYNGRSYMLHTPDGTEFVPGERVSDGFFRTLGITPLLGRDFYAGEDLPGAPHTVILSYGAWQRRFGGRKDVIGETVTLSDQANIIIGVLPQGFQFAPRDNAEFWTTLHVNGSCDLRRGCHGLTGIGRLKDGISVETALADMQSIAQQLERQYPDSNRGQAATVAPLSDVFIGPVRPILLVMLGGAALLLLIACVNVASLLLVRSEGRKREIAVRGALGASPARLVRQFVTEGLVLMLAGSLLGLAFAHWAMRLLAGLIPANMMINMPYLRGLGLNLRVLAFAGAVSLMAAALFSVTPMLRLSFADLRDGLAEGGRGTAGTMWRRLGANLVVVELAIAMVLLVGAGLLGKSFYRLLHVDLGFQPDHLATLRVAAPDSKYSNDERQIALARQIVDRISSEPGIKSVGISSQLVLNGNGNTSWIRFLDRPYHGEHNEVNEREVSSGYFATLQARLLRGRYFTDTEDASKPGVVVINQALAKQYFPGEDPIGKKIGNTTLTPKSIVEIIGIVEDIKEGSLDSEIWPAVYYPYNQNPNSIFFLAVRTTQPEESVLPTLSGVIHQIDPNIGTNGEVTMRDRIHDSPSAYLHRSSAWIVGGFAAVALLLGVVGLYGVIAYSVSRRTREIGIRMALGAQRKTVYQLILKEAGWLITFGIVAGLVCSVIAATLSRKLLFGTQSWDVPTLIGVSVVLAVAALLASYVPARRAASVNPVEALRSE